MTANRYTFNYSTKCGKCVCGSVRFGSVRFGSVRFGSVRFGSVRFGSVRFGSVRFGSVRFGSVRFGSVRFGSVRFGSVRFGSVRFGSVRFGSVRFGSVRSVRFGSVRFGSVRFGSVRFGSVRFGSVRFGSVGSFGSVRFGSVRFGSVRFGSVRFGSVRFGSVRFGSVRFGSVRFGSVRFVRFGSVRFGSVRFGSVRFGSVRFGSVRFGSVRFGSVRFGSVRFGSVRFGSVRFGSVRSKSKNVISTDAGMVKRANLLGRTSSTPPPNVSVSGVFVLGGVDDGHAEALDNMRGVFSELPILMTVDEATKSAPSGIDTNVDMSTGSTSHKVPTGLAFHQAAQAGNEGFEWVRFDREPAAPPNQFMMPYWNALLYVCHIITAHHIRALLFGRRHRRFGRYRYRLVNPNSRSNRRRRRILRLTTDIFWILRDAWSLLMIWMSRRLRDETVEIRESLFIEDSAAAPARSLIDQTVPASRRSPMASPNFVFLPASSPVVLTLLETPAAPWPPLSLLPAAAAAVLGVEILPPENPAAAQRLALPTALLIIFSAVPLVGRIVAPWLAPVTPQILDVLAGLLLRRMAHHFFEVLAVSLLEILTDLLKARSRGTAPLPLGAPAADALLLLGPPAVSPRMILPAAPLLLDQPAVPRLLGAPAARLMILPDARHLEQPAAPLLILPAAPLLILPAAALLLGPPAAPLRILPAAPLLEQPVAPLLLDPVAAPLRILPAETLLEPPAAAALGGAIVLEPPIVPAMIIPDFQRLIIPAALPRFESPAAPLPPALPIAPLPPAPEAAVATPLDAVNWSSVARSFAVMDLMASDRMEIPERGWRGVIEASVDGLTVVCGASERAAVRWILTEAVELYPNTGYVNGSEHAALAMYRGMRGDKEAALGVFVSAVSSLCTCQGLPSHVVHCLIQATLEVGNNGPAVSLWVMHCLLNIAEADCKRNMDATPDLCIRSRLVSAGQTIITFEDLSRHAPMTLSSFVHGYAAAVFGQVR
eukprot:jgi/Undpi1/10003/HiC_scaffold_28.g12457.m1